MWWVVTKTTLELTLRIYSQLRWWLQVIVCREKFPQFARCIVRGVLYYPCSMVLGQIFCRFTGSVAQTHCARRPQLVSKEFWKKFSQEQIFASWRLIAKIAKISALQKFHAIWYSHYHPLCSKSFCLQIVIVQLVSRDCNCKHLCIVSIHECIGRFHTLHLIYWDIIYQ